MNALLHCAGALFAVTLLAACDGKQADTFPGYVEADYVRLAAPISGTLAKLHLNRGDKAPESAPARRREKARRTARISAVRQRRSFCRDAAISCASDFVSPISPALDAA